MAMLPMRRNPLTSMLNFAAERDREAASLGSVITQLAAPALWQMGVQTEDTPQSAVWRGAVPMAQPLGTASSQPMAATPVAAIDDLKANVFPGESGGDYNALFGYANRPGGKFEGVDLTDMTVDEVVNFTDPKGPYAQWVKDQIGRVATPTGAFQVVGTTLKDAIRGLGLTGDEPYNEATQDAIGTWIYENQGPQAWEGWGRKGGGGSGSAGAAAGGNVEDILAQLYPEASPEDLKKEKRKDFWSAASQGLSALSQGRPQDFSNIRQAQEERKRQVLLDMRERERARAAASLVYSQTGDSALASGIATGAINYGDVLSERQMRRADALADEQRIKDAAASDRLGGVLSGLGVSDDIVAAVKAGDDPTPLLSAWEKKQAADRLAEEDLQQENVYAQNIADANFVLQSAAPGSLEEQAAKRVVALGGTEDVYTLLKDRAPDAAKGFTLKPGETRFGPGGEQVASIPAAAGAANEVADIAKANLLFDGGATNPATGVAFTSPAEALAAIQFYKQPSAAAGEVSLQYGPEGFTFKQGPAGQQPAQAGGAVVDVAKPEAGTATVVQDGALTAVPIAGSVDYAARKQALQQAIDEAPSSLAKKQLENEKLQLEIEELSARKDVDAATREAQLAGLQAEAAKKQAEVETLAKDAAAQSTAQYTNATRSFAVFERAAKDVIAKAEDAWTTGAAGKVAFATLPWSTERSSFLEAVRQMGSQSMLDALAEAKAAGVTLTPVSNMDVAALGASQSRLSNPEALEGEDILKETVFQYNYAKDALVGPKDLTRVDEFGQPYSTSGDTLGLTEDTFARHWREIPPAVAAAWRAGDIDVLPTDDPRYAEAAATLNQYAQNWEVYQGKLDRKNVGVLPPPPSPEDADVWPDMWMELSVAERAAYRKKMKKGD